ncbi:unnamed protein product [Dovyalis caffra]|uniref:Uncharacterized protein n=1 Tax=Dovyalis caffra TaxID=77055 RepID=A0AAV1RNG4_9ROSI|nr:unnamed protein product [Dovyalis caffra]
MLFDNVERRLELPDGDSNTDGLDPEEENVCQQEEATGPEIQVIGKMIKNVGCPTDFKDTTGSQIGDMEKVVKEARPKHFKVIRTLYVIRAFVNVKGSLEVVVEPSWSLNSDVMSVWSEMLVQVIPVRVSHIVTVDVDVGRASIIMIDPLSSCDPPLWWDYLPRVVLPG